MRRLAALGATLALLLLAAPAAADPLTVMTFNVWYGGAQVEFDRVGQAIRAADADVVGVQEPEGNLRRIAEAAGMSYTDETLHLASRYPIYAVERGGIRFGYVAVGPGRVVAVGNVHLPSSPYGPELVRDGKAPAEVLANERATRLGEMRPYLGPLSRQAARGVPTFLTGDFNSPSHLDWSPAAAATRPQVKYPLRWPVSAALERAGFRDSYREIFPDPVARPGLTWTAGTPPPRIRKRETLDRIDWVTASGPATTLSSRLVGEPGGPDVDVGVPWGSDHRAVASTFEVQPAPAPPLAHAEPRVVRRGSTVTIRYMGAGGPAKRIGIVPARGGRPLASLPIADTSGPPSGVLRNGRAAAGRLPRRAPRSRPRACLLTLLGARGGRAATHPNVTARVRPGRSDPPPLERHAGQPLRLGRDLQRRTPTRPVRLPRLQLPRRTAGRPHVDDEG